MQNKVENKQRVPPVCRTCLTPIRGISFRLQEQSGFGKGLMFTHILRYIVPELYLGLSTGPELCFECKESLRIAYTFRKRCLETEALIGDYLKNMQCSAQVIDLSAVIEYIKQFKGQLDAQSILSEWNEDSIEDFPQDPLSNEGTKQASKTDTVHSEEIRTLVPQQPTPELSTNSILSSNASKQVIRKIRIPILPKPTEPIVVESSKCKKNKPTQPEEVNKENKTSKPPEHRQRVEVLKVCPQTGLFKNKEGKYLNLEGKELPESVVREIKKENIDKEHKENEKLFPSTFPNIKNQENSNKKEPTMDKNQGNISKQNNLDNIVIENSMSICEETGLLRDQNGHYFDFSGNPLEDEQVEAEKRKAKIRGENLFKISNICTVSDEVFDKEKDNQKSASDFEEKIDVYQITKQDTSKKNTTVPPTMGFDNTAGSSKEDNLLKKQSGSSANILNFQADENLRIPQQWNPNQIFNSSSVLQTALTNQQMKAAHNLLGTHLVLSPDSSTAVLNTNKTPSQATSKQVEVTNNKSESNVKKLSGNIVLCPVTIKSEPLEEPAKNPLADDNEDTLSAPDLSLDDASNTSSWQKLINSLDSCDNSQYVDVPEFVEIQNFSLEDFFKLKKQTKVQDGKEKNDNLKITMLNSNKKLSVLKPPQKNVEKKTYNLPDQFMYRGRLLIRTEDGYKLDDSVPITGNDKPDGNKPLNTGISVQDSPLSNADKCKNYRNRKKGDDKISINKTKSNAEYCRMYRMRKKMIKQEEPQSTDVISNATLTSQQTITTDTQKGKKLKLTTVRKEQKIPEKVQIVDRELCVLFTHYTKDGFYVNDHDYLTSPYARNNLLFFEGKTRYCMCYICGVKHLLKDHINHMNSHCSTCPRCCVNLGTPYMLNLHMRIHSKSCQYCTEIVPYPLIKKHLSEHKREEEEEETDEDASKQKNKKKRKQIKRERDDEVRFSGVLPTSARLRKKLARPKRETRSSAKTEDLPVNKLEEDPVSKRRSNRKRGTDTAQDPTPVPHNPYVSLERLPDHLINNAVEKEIDTKIVAPSDGHTLDINNYKMAIHEAIKIKTEPKSRDGKDDKETDVKEDNDKDKTRKITVKEIENRRGKEENDEMVSDKRVLRSRLRKKENNEHQTSNILVDESDENTSTDDESFSFGTSDEEDEEEEDEEFMEDD
ncbi:uncharacterized protein LOC130898958 [Diorhabda carinulata]|uniref:uncharacterized protein LOC130898958 n=1 Tax=Diorhabda carinulata TaxID=1163345 RepID=UPI0025A28E87|nr:uncharacterized protein LOC130898958 [Diorhabda carinulata]